MTLFLIMGLTLGMQARAGSLTIRSEINLNSVEVVNRPEVKAREFLRSVAGELNLKPDLSDLQMESVSESAVGYHIRFVQMKGGLPVRDSGVVLTLSRTGQVISYQSSYSPTDNFKNAPSFSISRETAVSLAFAHEHLKSNPTTQQVEQAVRVIDGTSRAIYTVKFSAPEEKKWAWETVVDADSGAIYESKSLTLDANENTNIGGGGKPAPQYRYLNARVFDPNPTILSDHAYGTLDGFTDNKNDNSAFFDAMMKQTTIQVSNVNGLNVLTNQYVTITDQETPKNPDCNSAFSMNYRRSDPCFDSVNAFYHISKSLEYLNETLGIDAHPILYKGPFHVDPHGLDGEDNSHYNPFTDEIAFGEGGVDDAQDHDVLLHELGHAIHNWVTHGHISKVEGLSEGIGDYWAASYARSQMRPSNIAYDWIFSFDGHNEFWGGRSVKVDRVYPSGVQGDFAKDIHVAGGLWTATCIDIWSAIGKYPMDRIFWAGIAMLNEHSNQLDAAKAVYAAAKIIYPQNLLLQETVKEKFIARGYQVE